MNDTNEPNEPNQNLEENGQFEDVTPVNDLDTLEQPTEAPVTTPLGSSFDPMPIETPAPEAPVFGTPAPRKSHKKLIITIAVLAALLLAAAGFIVYLLFFQPKATDSSSTNNAATTTPSTEQTTNGTDALSARDIIEKVRSSVTTELGTIYASLKIEESTYAPAYKAPNVAYAVGDQNNGVGLAISPIPTSYDADAIAKVGQTVNNTLGAMTELKKSSNDWLITYQNADVICTVSADGTPISVSCADISIYSDAISKVAPFAAAYLASEAGKQYGDGVVMSLQRVNEKTDGYRNAWISMGNTNSPVGGFAGLFYAKGDTWSYWKGTQSLIECTDYNTHDLQKAFEGDSCYASEAPDQMSTVKVTL